MDIDTGLCRQMYKHVGRGLFPAWIFLAAGFFVGGSAGAGTFVKAKKSFLVGPHPCAVVARDLNDDGLPEIVTADRGVLAENSIAFYLALRQHDVPAELHIYAKGGHGLGLAANVPGTCSWPERCTEWMRGRGLLEQE